jgi:hypothetical protein
MKTFFNHGNPLIMLIMVQTLFAQTIWDGTADTTWYTDDKSATEFTITTAEQLAGLARLVNGSDDNDTYSMYGKTIKLGASIMLNDTADWEDWVTNPPANEWVAIGTNKNRFLGAFDGSNYVVSGVYINSESDNQGLFGYISTSAEIKNLGVIASYVKGKKYIGGLIGYNFGGKVINSYFIGTVTGGGNVVGGLVGYNGGTISDSYFTGTVMGKDYVSGLAGENYRECKISNSYSTGMVMGEDVVGGLVGYNGGAISDSYSTSTVIGENGVGGLSAGNGGTIKRCYSTGTVTGKESVGGLSAGNGGTIETSYSTGMVTGTGDYVGGLVGSSGYRNASNVKIINNYSIGMVTGKNYVGGLVGFIYDTEIKRNYSVGKVTGTGPYVHGSIGEAEYSIRYDNLYDNQINEGSYDQSDYAYGSRTTEAMKRESTFKDWDFREIWGIDNTINDGYPYLLDLKNTVTTIRLPQIANNQIAIRATNSGIMLENLPKNAKVKVYNLHGKLVYSGNPENPKILKIMVQTKGIYIIKIGTQTFRVAVGQK